MAMYKNKDELLNTDWQKKIDEAAALGNWQAAAQYEQARNEKIASPEYTGSQTATYRYVGYLPEQEAPAPAAAVTREITNVPEAVRSGALPDFDDSALLADKPVYTDAYADRIGKLLAELEDRETFSYDPETDPLYQQYREQYRRESSRAAEDTLAAAAAHAGGMNSYAVTAAQQAGDYYNARLMERIPELAQLAYEMYLDDYSRDVDRLERLQAQETEEYGRWQDALSDWYARMEDAYQRHRDTVADSKWQADFDARYGAEEEPEEAESVSVEEAAAEYLRANGYTEEEIGGLLSESAWTHQRERYLAAGGGAAEAAYPSYESYVRAYLRYLSEQ